MAVAVAPRRVCDVERRRFPPGAAVTTSGVRRWHRPWGRHTIENFPALSVDPLGGVRHTRDLSRPNTTGSTGGSLPVSFSPQWSFRMPFRASTRVVFLAVLVLGVALGGEREDRPDKFRQLDEILPTPNIYRTASGAPGHAYWQQRADYVIDVEIDDDKQHLTGSETIRYTNHSPDELKYLWVQVDANILSPQSHSALSSWAPDLDEEQTYRSMRRMLARPQFDGSASITAVRDAEGNPLPHTIVDTMMRIDLPQPLRPSDAVRFSIDWNYAINHSKEVGARTGYEFFEDDGNCLYELAHWFPRMAAYTDVNGWQNKQFLGRGEFTLEFGDYQVAITVPDDHVVAATGVLQNPDEVLSPVQRDRLEQAKSAKEPIYVVTPDEALENEKTQSTEKKTWVFHADNVRDFAFATSRKFIWDAKYHKIEGENPDKDGVLCMSFFPKEGDPLWSRYSTHSIIHTIDVYSRFTFPYPYPVAISVNGPVGGMEYPMICFNGPRPEEDGTYSKRAKYGLISVIIHEVGHNWFPMIVNSDERQWTWMDEGLNTFVQYLAEQEWEEDYPSWRGEPKKIVDYMTDSYSVPIMTNSESILQSGSNAYAKPATALNILRETVMGRELFDFAFKEYSNRWKFRRPEPSDLFRTMEDASAVDLDWFWRGWFYTTDHTDLSIESVDRYLIDSRDPNVEKTRKKKKRDEEPKTLAQTRNKELPKRVDAYPQLADFYNEYDELDVTPQDVEKYEKLVKEFEDDEADLLATDLYFHVVGLENKGGLVMPVILEVEYEDGEVEEVRVPAEIWRRNPWRASKLLMGHRKIERITLDPHLETADAELSNNHYPRKTEEKRFRLKKREEKPNPMRDAREAEEKGEEEAGSELGEAGTEGG